MCFRLLVAMQAAASAQQQYAQPHAGQTAGHAEDEEWGQALRTKGREL
jgi:hypothetical protein